MKHSKNNSNNNYIIMYNITRIEHGACDGIPHGIAAVSLWEFSRRRTKLQSNVILLIIIIIIMHADRPNGVTYHDDGRRSRKPRTPRERSPPFPSRLRPGATRSPLVLLLSARQVYYNIMYIIILYTRPVSGNRHRTNGRHL